MTLIFATVVAIGLLAAVFFWQRLLRSRQTSPSRALWLALLFLMLGLALQITVLHDLLAYGLGVNLFWPTQWALIMACTLMLHYFAVHVSATSPAEDRRATAKMTLLAVIFGGAFLVATALFATSWDDPAFIVGPRSRLEIPGPVSVPVGMAWVIIMVPLGVSCASHALRAHRWAVTARRDAQPWLRTGMRISQAGFVFATAYFAHSAGYLTAEMVGWIPSWPQRMVTDPLISAAPTLVFIGTVAPATEAWLRERREGSGLLRRLRPVERLLAPQLAASRMRGQRAWRWWQRLWRPSTLVYQSVIDLEDAYLRVQRELPSTLPDSIARGHRDDTVLLAATLAALAARARGAGRAEIAAVAATVVAASDQVADADPTERTRTVLTGDLDRWLRAADLLVAASRTTARSPGDAAAL